MKKVIIVVACLAVLGVLEGAAVFWAFLRSPPSDASLVVQFQRHRSELDALASAALADSDLASAFRGRALLRRAGVMGIRRSPDGCVRLGVMSNYDVRKGFVYSTRPLAPVRSSLDGLERAVGNGYLRAVYRPLAGDWYIFIEDRE